MSENLDKSAIARFRKAPRAQTTTDYAGRRKTTPTAPTPVPEPESQPQTDAPLGERPAAGKAPQRAASASKGRRRNAAAPAPELVRVSEPEPEPAPVVEVEPAVYEAPAPAPRRRSRTSNPMTPSVVWLPEGVHERTVAYRERMSLTSGQVIICALEYVASVGKLAELNYETGESHFPVFATSVAATELPPRAQRKALNYTLRASDFPTVDSFVTQLGAASRVDLIARALAMFLDHEDAPKRRTPQRKMK